MEHRLTRASVAALIVALAPSASLGAQRNWQGVVTFQQDRGTAEYYQGSGIARLDMKEGSDTHSVIIDPSHSTMTILMPEQHQYMTMDTKTMGANVQKKLSESKISDTGKGDVIAGHKCEYYHMVDPDDKSEADACIATDMGTFAMVQMPMQGRGSVWQRLLAGHTGGFFPLKVISHKDGKDKVDMQATKIEARSLDAALFKVPDGYTQMGMGGMSH